MEGEPRSVLPLPSQVGRQQCSPTGPRPLCWGTQLGAKMWLAGRSPTLAPPVPKLHSAGKGPQENDRENPTFLTPALCDLQEECALLCIFFPPCKHRPSPAGCGLSEVTPAAASGREETASGLVCSEVTHLARVRPAGIPGTDHTL